MHPVRKARLCAGLNLRQLSDRGHLSIPTLRKIESGEQVSELSVFKIARALKLDPEGLIGEMREGDEAASQLEHKQPA
jgi:transcriptional regulator with XRE-family HTH domain